MENLLAVSVMSVRSKPVASKRRFGLGLWIYLTVAMLVVAAGIFAVDVYTGVLGIMTPTSEVVQNGAFRIIRVPPGGNVQAAIERSESGDIVELQAGAVYFGTIKLPNKPLTDFVTIQSSAIANLPADKRVGPGQKSSMATIATRGGGSPAVLAENGANHYRFAGIEFTASSAEYNYNLVTLGSGERTMAMVPRDLEIDRSYLHPFKSGVIRRGIAVNSQNTTIKNSHIEGFGFANEETQGICGWTGSRNVRILNNYVEGGAENIMFGGSDPSSAELIPTDIEVIGNHLNKPSDWAGRVATKTLFELKNAKRVLFKENLLTNNWGDAAFRITVRNQDGGAPFSTIEDVVIKDNIVDGAGAGINVLGKDDGNVSQSLKRLTVSNNLFLNIGGGTFGGAGYFLQIADGQTVTISNNTVFNRGNIASFHGDLPRGFTFHDNITGHGEYGIHGIPADKSSAGREMFQNNIFINLNSVARHSYGFPVGNTMVQNLQDVGFVSPPIKDFRLSPTSIFRGRGRGGKNVGSDLLPSERLKSN